MTRLTTLAAALALTAGGALAATPGEEFLTQWDGDGDGAVTRAEADERRAAIFEMFDADGDGALSAAEQDAMRAHRAEMAEAGHGAGQGRGRGWFRGRGREQAMGDRGHGGRRGMGGGERAMARLDGDGDGAIQRAEFLAVTADWFAHRDRSGDGVITADDFGR